MTRLRCAIYTRKSSEEGLDQDYNSLDAQRDACLSYIRSQKGEGWSLSPGRYDDGGWSGGTMERPGLRRLLADIEAGLIDVVVVYKVDRLTRSLADFARIVDILDCKGASFVSVTQAFNTTSSMGRLTLNVLLSFAQFEREVTGERIRDKIAASKARGMWMGGMPPLGYTPLERTLSINPTEAQTVRHIFRRYIEIGSVHELVRQLRREGIHSKRWTTAKGIERGGIPFSRGALFHLLRNRIYLGEIVHRDKVYPGQHDAIIDRELFDTVQVRLGTAIKQRRDATSSNAPLTGKLFDACGNRMSPTHSGGRGAQCYRYYVSSPNQIGQEVPKDIISRIPALAIEQLVLDRLRGWSGDQHAEWSKVQTNLQRIEVHTRELVLTLAPATPKAWLQRIAAPDQIEIRPDGANISIAAYLQTRGGRSSVIASSGRSRSRPDSALISGLRRSHQILAAHGIQPLDKRATCENAIGIDDPWQRGLAKLAFLAPDIQRAILTGRQPAGLTLASLTDRDIPLDWDAQRDLLGF